MKKCKHSETVDTDLYISASRQYHRQAIVQRATLVSVCQKCGQQLDYVVRGGIHYGQAEEGSRDKAV